MRNGAKILTGNGLILLFLLSIAAGPSWSTTFVSPEGNDSVIDADYNDDIFLTGNMIRFDGKVRGDIYTTCYEIVQSDTVEGNVIFFSRLAQSLGPVRRSLGGFAEIVTCNSSVGRNLTAFARKITVGPDANIGLDAILYASNVVFQGNASGNLKIRSDRAVFSGTVGGNLDFSGGDLTISPDAVIKGDLIYCSPEKAEIKSPSSIGGEIKWTQCTVEKDKGISLGGFLSWLISHRGYFLALSFFSLLFFILSVIPFPGGLALFGLWATLLASGNIFILLSKNLCARTEAVLTSRTFPSIGVGFATLFLTPVVTLILILSIFGLPLGAIMLLLFGVACFAGAIYATLFLGRRICVLLNLASKESTGYGCFSLGMVILVALSFIPFLGYFITLIVVMMGLGGLTLAIYGKSDSESAATPAEE